MSPGAPGEAAGGTPLTVLVVSGGGFQGLAIVRALRDCGPVRVVLADCFADNLTRHLVDGFRVVPPIAEGPAFREGLETLSADEGVRLVIPATQRELAALADAREALGARGVEVAVSDRELLEVLTDRRRLHAWLGKAGVPTLPLLDATRAEVPLPILGRPVSGWGSRDVLLVRSREELLALPGPARSSTHVWQPLLESFEELSVDFAIDFQGRPSAFGFRRRVRVSGGFAVISETHTPSALQQDVLQRLATRLAAEGGRGLFNVQLLVAETGFFVSDVNPRAGTSSTHWCGTALNPARHLCRDVAPELSFPAPSNETPPWRTFRPLEERRVPAPEERVQGVRGVVFDLDDTLFDHKAWIRAKLEAVHAAHADALPPRAAFLRQALWLLEEEARRADLLDAVCERLERPASLAPRLLAAWREARVEGRLFGDVAPALESLRRAGIATAVLTDNPPDSQREKLGAAGLEGRFDAVVFAREAGAEKPDPRPFQAVAQALGLAPEALVSVGNNPYRDVLGALEAGFAAGFLLRRPVGLSSYDAASAVSLATDPRRFHVVDGLQPLLLWLGLV